MRLAPPTHRRASVRVAIAFAILPPLLAAAPAASGTPLGAPLAGELLVVEVKTGGASASDERIVVESTARLPRALDGVALSYRSASGATNRTLLDLAPLGAIQPGERLIFANAIGCFAPAARATWSDGLAATGGAVAVAVHGSLLDAVAWGSAVASAGGEGLPAIAPGATAALARRRDALGAPIDTGSNAIDFEIVADGAPPTPSPTLVPGPVPPPSTAPVEPLAVGTARRSVVGTTLLVRGVVLAAPGDLADARTFAIADPSTGEGLFVLGAAGQGSLPSGATVDVVGRLVLRYQSLTLLAGSPAIELPGASAPPAPLEVPPGDTSGPWGWEPWEARRVTLVGTVAGSASPLAGGALAVRLRRPDGSILALGASAAAVADLPAGLLVRGATVRATGLILQRGGSAGGGYRLWIEQVAGLVPWRAAVTRTPKGGAGSGGRADGTSRATPRHLPPLGVPSIAFTAQSVPGDEMAEQRLAVRDGDLVLGAPGPLVLVQLPPCAPPSVVRAGDRLTVRAQRAYAQAR